MRSIITYVTRFFTKIVKYIRLITFYIIYIITKQRYMKVVDSNKREASKKITLMRKD